MPEYRYTTRTNDGSAKNGTLIANSLDAASATLRGRGEKVVELAPVDASSKKKWYQAVNISFGPSQKEICSFTNQLSVMLRAGIPLRSAIEGIAEQTTNPKFHAMLRHIQRDLESGKQLSEALSRYPRHFGSLYINMVKASEMSGGLSKMLDRVAAYLQQNIETSAMVKGAMIYPGIIGTLAVGVTIFLLTWVLPRFMVMFKGKEQHLPTPTKFLLAASDFMTSYWWAVLIGIGLAVGGVVFALRTEPGRAFFDTLALRVPLVKKMFRALCITRSLHTMGQLINAGVPMLDVIGITADVSGNTHYRRLWRRVQTNVQEGKKISQPLQQSNLLPKSVVQMVGAGEESGKLGEVLDEVAEYYRKELVGTIKAVTGMIEPLMIVVMGGLVGFIAMSIILPIFKMSEIATKQ
jgi:type IV pilus assembly protein PilC